MATVRGIGVAVITSRCGGRSALPRRASRCSTPKRCCSSTTTRPRSANATCSWIRACVPTTMPAAPLAASSSAARRAAAGSEPVSRATRVACSAPSSRPAWPSAPSMPSIVRACWLASTSVGCQQRGLSAGVDDLQHGPQRNDGLSRADLALQQPMHRVRTRQLPGQFRAHVALPGGEFERQAGVERSQRCRRPIRGRGVAGFAAAAARRCARASCTPSASSHLRRCRAAHHCSRLSGWCIASQCAVEVHQPVPGQDIGRHRVGDPVEHCPAPARRLCRSSSCGSPWSRGTPGSACWRRGPPHVARSHRLRSSSYSGWASWRVLRKTLDLAGEQAAACPVSARVHARPAAARRRSAAACLARRRPPPPGDSPPAHRSWSGTEPSDTCAPRRAP